jgi:hypothetical protein
MRVGADLEPVTAVRTAVLLALLALLCAKESVCVRAREVEREREPLKNKTIII